MMSCCNKHAQVHACNGIYLLCGIHAMDIIMAEPEVLPVNGELAKAYTNARPCQTSVTPAAPPAAATTVPPRRSALLQHSTLEAHMLIDFVNLCGISLMHVAAALCACNACTGLGHLSHHSIKGLSSMQCTLRPVAVWHAFSPITCHHGVLDGMHSMHTVIIINPCKPYLSASATAPHPLGRRKAD
jgi:hypothetical protein